MIDQPRSFDRAADEYERARPGYPPAVLDLVPLSAAAEVLDLGAGTGKLTRALVGRYARVVAVEPLDGMRAILERIVPGAESRAGSAEAIPLADASVDGVFAGQAFHWFANDDAVAEIARVLRPGGVLAIVWNHADEDRPSPLPADYEAYFEELHAPSITRVREAEPVADLLGRGPFGELREGSVAHEQVLDRAGVLDFARSMSWIAHMPDEKRAAVVRRLEELLPEGSYAFPMRASIEWAVRA